MTEVKVGDLIILSSRFYSKCVGYILEKNDEREYIRVLWVDDINTVSGTVAYKTVQDYIKGKLWTHQRKNVGSVTDFVTEVK